VLPPERQPVGDRIDDLGAPLCEEGVRVLQVPQQQVERVVVVSWVDGLRKVDDRRPILPEKDVVGGEVGVNAPVLEEEFDVSQDLRVETLGVLLLDGKGCSASPMYSIRITGPCCTNGSGTSAPASWRISSVFIS